MSHGEHSTAYLTYRNGMFIIMDVREANFIFTRTNIDEETLLLRIAQVTSILDARFSNKFIFDEREARSEREKGLFIKTRQDSTARRKVTRKKKVKFAILLDGLFIC